MAPLRVTDILELLTLQPDCGCISMSAEDFYDLRTDLASMTQPFPHAPTKPMEWRMDRPRDVGTIFGVPIAIV